MVYTKLTMIFVVSAWYKPWLLIFSPSLIDRMLQIPLIRENILAAKASKESSGEEFTALAKMKVGNDT